MTDLALAVCQDLASYARTHDLTEADRLLLEIMAVLHGVRDQATLVQERA